MSSIDTLNCVVKTRTKVKQCKVHCQQVRLGFVQEYRDDSITDDDTKLRRAFSQSWEKYNNWKLYERTNCFHFAQNQQGLPPVYRNECAEDYSMFFNDWSVADICQSIV